WTMSDEMQATTGVVIGTTYPAPIVDETEARNQGIKATHAARRTDEVKARSAQVYAMHGSRARRFQRRGRAVQRRAEKPSVNPQTTLLDFGN
ncbi:MAG: hypothetical protein VX965_05875, partial [Candidatus Thermoplasmatota archaeon]|nr:hypothetical protein [Candidatus Thermoplasmatota archaeon]